MKQYALCIMLGLLSLEARNPFFLYKKPSTKKRYILKGTLIGDTHLACIQRDGILYNSIGIGETVGECTILEITYGIVRIKHANGQIEMLHLEEKTKAGERECL